MKRWIAAVWMVVVSCGGADPVPPMPDGMVCQSPEPQDDGLVVAGSGSNLPLARMLAVGLVTEQPETIIHIPESIGTGGAARAVRDGAVDIGLASRPLKPRELSWGLVQTPMARSVLAVVAHPGVKTQGVPLSWLVDVYSGAQTTWPDGSPVRLMLREAGDSGLLVVKSALPELHAAMLDARAQNRALVLHTDQEMRDALLRIEGAVGLLDAGVAKADGVSLNLLALDGVQPDVAAVRSGRYTLVKPLSWITQGPPGPQHAPLLGLTRSAAVEEALARHGYLVP